MFCSYRSTDRLAVQEFAAKLRASGVDAWFDHWEIQAGDDIVARMDEGLDSCEAALIFVSEAWFDGRWARDEYTTLALRRVEDGIRLIPVMLEDVADRLPAGLRKLARRSVEDFDAIRDTLLGVDRKPGVTTALRAETRAVTVEFRDEDSRVGVRLLVDGDRQASVDEVTMPPGLDLGNASTSALLGGLGRRMGSVVFPARSAPRWTDCWTGWTRPRLPTFVSPPPSR